MKKFLFLAFIPVISACASIIEGSTQTLNIVTAPSFPSNCTVKGEEFQTSFTAPGAVNVPKSVKPIEITCMPENGSAAGTAKVLSDVGAWGYGGAALGVGVGAIVDAGTGAANKYPDNITIPLGQTTTIGLTPMNSNADFNK
jgi:hypothetical protein